MSLTNSIVLSICKKGKRDYDPNTPFNYDERRKGEIKQASYSKVPKTLNITNGVGDGYKYKFVSKPTNPKEKVIMYIHGGGFVVGSVESRMSFNEQYAYELGELVAQEMDIFGVHLWLAPALNIHRNIRCGRNFEYFSEDPLVSGVFAAAITKGVQSHPNRGVTIKHFAGNNQELNRTNNNDHVSERAMREIYLRGFEFCIRESKPFSIMTSYNLINGVHTSEHYGLINDILRCEWGFEGLVMTDWVQSGRSFCSRCKYPATFAHKNVLSGNDLTMPGAPKDEKDIMKALRKGILTREDLLVAASRIYRSIELINK